MFDGEEVPAAGGMEAVLDTMLLKTGRCSNSLRRAGWSSEEVFDMLGLDLRQRKEPH